ncbi:universal stress protein [Halobaculum sp. D14]|uniref:universal stress protein n=1 Tax=Halobaculum sp. D14 TaxID=3421642 RepID=UPI003EB8954B
MTATVLLPLRVLEDESVAAGLFEFLSPTHVLVLGYYEVPDQTPPEAARDQFDDRAQSKLDDVRAAFEAAGATADTRMVYTGEAEQTIGRIAAEEAVDAVVHPGAAMDVDRLLVPLVGQADVDRVAAFVAELVGGRDIDVTVFGLDESLTPDEIESALADAGLSPPQLTTETGPSGSPVDAIAEAAVDFDAVVMGEPKPTLSEWVFGELEARVATEALGPVFVVRAVTEETDEGADTDDGE